MGNGSFGHARFKSVKSKQTLHLSFFFFTTTVFASHSGKKTSFTAPASFNFLTYCLTTSMCSLVDLFGFCFLGGNNGSTLRTMNSRSTPGSLYGLYANMSTFCTRNNNIPTLSSFFILAPIWKLLSSSGSILTFIRSLAPLAPISLRGSYNCYKRTSSVGSFCLVSWLTAATKHCLTTCRFPHTIAIPCSVQNFTFLWRVDGTAPIA